MGPDVAAEERSEAAIEMVRHCDEAVAAQLGVGIVSSVEVSPDPRVRAVPINGAGLVNLHMLGCMERRAELRLIKAFMELAV